MCDEVNQIILMYPHVLSFQKSLVIKLKKDIERIASNKATGINGIGVKVVKIALPATAPLTHIYNASIISGIFL